MQAQCLHILYISSACSVCAQVFVYVREDSPLRQLHNLTLGGGERAGRALGTVQEWPRRICTKTESVLHTVKIWLTCVTGQHTPRQFIILYLFSAMNYVKAIKVIEWLRKSELGNLSDDSNKGEGDLNQLMQRKTGFLFFYLHLSLSFSLLPPLSFLSVLWGYPFLPSTPSKSTPPISISLSVRPVLSLSSLSLSLPLFFFLF